MFHTSDGRKVIENLDEFDDAREVVAGLAAEYQACERPDYVSLYQSSSCLHASSADAADMCCFGMQCKGDTRVHRGLAFYDTISFHRHLQMLLAIVLYVPLLCSLSCCQQCMFSKVISANIKTDHHVTESIISLCECADREGKWRWSCTIHVRCHRHTNSCPLMWSSQHVLCGDSSHSAGSPSCSGCEFAFGRG